MSRKLWTPQDDAVLRRMYPDQTAAACGAALGCTASQIYGRAHKLGLEKSEAFKLSDLSKRIQTGKQAPGSDVYAATRRAIVQAAAEIGKGGAA